MNTGPKQRRPKLDSCYIAASLDADTSCLRSLLEHRQVEWTDVAKATPGASVLDTIAREIERTTFVCSVVPNSKAIANALFELGMAFGKGKPLFIIVDPRVKLPRELGYAHLVRARPSDRDAISFHLDAFLGHTNVHRHPHATRAPARKDEIIVQDILQNLMSLEPESAKQRGYQLESIVAEVFARAGAEVVNVSNDPHAYADLSMWLDDLSSTLGNPILVEIKCGKLSHARLAQADDRLFRALHVTDAKAALLVYWDEDGKTFRRRRRDASLVFWFSLHDLIQTVERGSLAQEIIERRNRAVHGLG